MTISEKLSVYTDRGFDFKQREQLRAGMEKGLDVFVYEDPAFTFL